MTLKAFLLFLLLPALTLGQKHATSYAEANPGVLKVIIDVSSDTAHLKSLIGLFDENDLSNLKSFFNSAEALNFQTLARDNSMNIIDLVKNKLDSLLKRKIDPCIIMASDTAYATFNTRLENEVTRPLILWVKKSYPMCQMQIEIWGFGEKRFK